MIRAATPADLEALARMVRAYYRYDGIEWNEERALPALRRLLEDERLGFASVVELGGAVVGYAIGTWGYDVKFGGRYVMLTDLWVDEDHRGAGHGSALLASVEERARAGGAHVIEGQVMRGNERARAFYHAWGFSFPDRLLMSRRL